MMKKRLAPLFLAAMFTLTACGAAPAEMSSETSAPAEASASVSAEASAPVEPNAPIELNIFAAASLTETLTEIQTLYAEVAPDVTLTFTFDSSGTLQTQIEQGAVCDLFLSAGQPQMDALEEENLLQADSRVNLLENKVTLCVPDGNPAAIEGFDSLAERLREGSTLLAMGNSDVPVGQYTQKIFDYYDLDESSIASCLTYGGNVKEVTTQVAEGSVDCGVIYCTDAFSAGLTIVDEATPEMCGQVIYPAAVLQNSANPEAAQALLDYLGDEEAMTVFQSVGFEPANAG